MTRFVANSVGLIALATASAAAAQDTSSAVSQGDATVSQSDSAAGIGDIVVTASRRAENAQRSALSIQAISSEALARANVSRPEDLNAVAAGVQIGTGGNYPQVYIRGVGNFATNALAEGAVAFNLDGVYISRGQATRGMFFDLERVEVLKGPQGTLYGRNASGGAINVITAKPKLGEIGGFAELQVGNYDLVEGTAALNLPLGETVGVRASGQVVSRDGYLSDGYDDEKTQSARLQFLWKPNEDFSLLLNGGYQHVGGRGAGGVLKPQLAGDDFRGASDPAVVAIYQAQPGLGPILVYPKTDGFVDYTTYSVGVELNWNMGFATLTVLPAYRDSKLHDGSYVSGFFVDNNIHSKQTSVEARLGNSGEKLKWVLGGYFFNEQGNNPGSAPSQRALQGPTTQIIFPLASNTRSYAAFGQATYSVTDRFRATGGLRYTYERKTLSQYITSYGFLASDAPPTCAPGTVVDFGSPTPPLFCRREIDATGANSSRLTYNSVTFKAGVEYDLAPHSLAYANVGTGFKSGGFYSAPPPNTFRPEKLTAFDVGVKNRFLDNRLQVNVEAFFWRYRDHQETSLGPTAIPGYIALLTYNAGKAKSYGGDLDILFRATSQDELSLKVQYNKTKYDSFVYSYQSNVFGSPHTGCAVGPVENGAQSVDCSGKPLMRAPQWAGSAGYSHIFELDGHGELRASFDTQFSSSYYLTTDFLPAGKQGSFAIGNFDLTYTSDGGRWVVSAFVHNIWDKAVYTQAFRSGFVTTANPLADPDGLFIGTLRPPRTFGGRVRVNF